MAISVFTPSHSPEYLDECYDSLLRQTYKDWEWIVLLNGDAQWHRNVPPNKVQVHHSQAKGVGALKREAVELCSGEILVELDHDDLLDSDALAVISLTFATRPEVGFVYSDCAQINPDGTRNDDQFDLANGWEYYETEVDGRQVSAVKAMEPFPHNLSYIWFAPNHVRAFRREVYEKVGGYDPERTILDDQDLMCRLYQETEFFHIPECLYLQRVGVGNTQSDPTTNARIQVETVQLYDQHIQPNALAWAKRNGWACLDLGAAHNSPEGYIGVDLEAAPMVGWQVDVNQMFAELADNSVGVVRAVDFMEHIVDKVWLMNEIHRVLVHGGLLLSLTPSTDGRGAFQDPTHVSYWNENSFFYYTNKDYSTFVPSITARFQSSRYFTFFPSDWHRSMDIPYVCANLVALHDGPRQGGYCLV